MHRTGLTFKRVRGNAGHLEIGKKHCIWSGIVYSDWHGKNNMNGERFRWWDGRVGPHSLPLILTTSVKYGKSPAMYNWTGLTFKRVRGNAGHLEIGKKHCIWSGIVYSDWHGKNNMNGERFRWWDGRVGPHSLPLILTTSVKYGKSPAMYNCVKCVCICVIVSLMIWFL